MHLGKGISSGFLHATLGASIGALGAVAITLAPATTASAAVDFCYEAALKETMLDEHQAQQLCDGSRTKWPVHCHVAAQDRLLLSELRSINLCQCARSLRPVACWEELADDTTLSDLDLLQRCNAARLNHVVLPGCISP